MRPMVQYTPGWCVLYLEVVRKAARFPVGTIHDPELNFARTLVGQLILMASDTARLTTSLSEGCLSTTCCMTFNRSRQEFFMTIV